MKRRPSPSPRASAWLHSVLGGVLWAVVYNAAWGLAWLGFMAREWSVAASSTGHPMPWTRDFWLVWIPLTVPFGIALAAYLNGASQRERPVRSVVAASLALWVPGTIGMVAWAAYSPRVIALDSAVNLIAVLMACAAARRGMPSGRPVATP